MNQTMSSLASQRSVSAKKSLMKSRLVSLSIPFPSWRFIPWILDHLGYQLMRQPDPPEETFSEVHSDDDEETKAKKGEFHDKKKKEADAAAKAAKIAA